MHDKQPTALRYYQIQDSRMEIMQYRFLLPNSPMVSTAGSYCCQCSVRCHGIVKNGLSRTGAVGVSPYIEATAREFLFERQAALFCIKSQREVLPFMFAIASNRDHVLLFNVRTRAFLRAPTPGILNAGIWP
jgi:hypothetical protein